LFVGAREQGPRWDPTPLSFDWTSPAPPLSIFDGELLSSLDDAEEKQGKERGGAAVSSSGSSPGGSSAHLNSAPRPTSSISNVFERGSGSPTAAVTQRLPWSRARRHLSYSCTHRPGSVAGRGALQVGGVAKAGGQPELWRQRLLATLHGLLDPPSSSSASPRRPSSSRSGAVQDAARPCSLRPFQAWAPERRWRAWGPLLPHGGAPVSLRIRKSYMSHA
jgi:hypothetical protein